MKQLIKPVAMATAIAFTSGCATTSGYDPETGTYEATTAEKVASTAGDVAKGTALTVAVLTGLVLFAGVAVLAAGAGAGGYTTKYEYDRNGQIGRIKSNSYEQRIRYNRDGRIREIKTRYR